MTERCPDYPEATLPPPIAERWGEADRPPKSGWWRGQGPRHPPPYASSNPSNPSNPSHRLSSGLTGRGSSTPTSAKVSGMRP